MPSSTSWWTSSNLRQGREPDATHLPVRLAVSLLKDRNGVIDLDLPMSGSLDDPKFRIGPIIWKIFVNLIVKVATSPFALLGHLFGGGEHVNIIEFPAGSAELDNPRDQLVSVAKALKERPALKLDVPIVYSATLDGPQLAATRLREEQNTRVLTPARAEAPADGYRGGADGPGEALPPAARAVQGQSRQGCAAAARVGDGVARGEAQGDARLRAGNR
jgi:hypothetical protein